MGNKIYAVRHGKKTGIFTKWEDCRENVIGVWMLNLDHSDHWKMRMHIYWERTLIPISNRTEKGVKEEIILLLFL